MLVLLQIDRLATCGAIVEKGIGNNKHWQLVDRAAPRCTQRFTSVCSAVLVPGRMLEASLGFYFCYYKGMQGFFTFPRSAFVMLWTRLTCPCTKSCLFYGG